MIALLLGLLLAAAPPAAQDLTGAYELHLPQDTMSLELSREGDEWRAIFQRPQMPPVHAQQVTVEGNVVEIVLRVHGATLNFHLEVTGKGVAGRYTADGGDATEFTGRRLDPPQDG